MKEGPKGPQGGDPPLNPAPSLEELFARAERDRSRVQETPEPSPSPPDPVRSVPDPALQGGTGRMSVIWERFRGMMLERVTVLEEATLALVEGQLDLPLRRSAEQAAHKLAGSLGTFGLADGTDLARSVELELQGEEPLEVELAQRLADVTLRLRATVEAGPSTVAHPASTRASPARASASQDASDQRLLVLIVEEIPRWRSRYQSRRLSAGSASVGPRHSRTCVGRSL